MMGILTLQLGSLTQYHGHGQDMILKDGWIELLVEYRKKRILFKKYGKSYPLQK